MDFITVNTPLLDGNEKKYLCECIDSGWISSEGKFVKQFETGVSAYIGRKYGVAVCKGSVALDLAVEALGLGGLEMKLLCRPLQLYLVRLP